MGLTADFAPLGYLYGTASTQQGEAFTHGAVKLKEHPHGKLWCYLLTLNELVKGLGEGLSGSTTTIKLIIHELGRGGARSFVSEKKLSRFNLGPLPNDGKVIGHGRRNEKPAAQQGNI